MRQNLIVGNWKMNGAFDAAQSLVEGNNRGYKGIELRRYRGMSATPVS